MDVVRSTQKIGFLFLAITLVGFFFSCASLSSLSMASMDGGHDFLCTSTHLFPVVLNGKDLLMIGFLGLVLIISATSKIKASANIYDDQSGIKQIPRTQIHETLNYPVFAHTLVRTVQRHVY